MVDAFYRVAQDRANKIVILTGAGGDFIPGIDFASFGNVADPGIWSQVHDEGTQIVENIANIRVPVIAAVEGRAHVHSEYALLANVIVASESATICHTSPGESYRAMESSRRGAIALEQVGLRHFCSTHSRLQQLRHTNGEWSPKSCQTEKRLLALRN